MTSEGRIIVRDAKYARDFSPLIRIAAAMRKILTRAYIRHLLKAQEILGLRLTTWHNLKFLLT